MMKFVPTGLPSTIEEIKIFTQYILSCKKLLVLTGAGISTESGIPDYRSQDVGLYARQSSRPMPYQTFLKSHGNRQRYWARNFIGWPSFSSRKPNIVHEILVNWEINNRIFHTISQNVDNLHIKSGLKKLVELHGNTHNVVCTNCDYQISRHKFQDILNQLNPNFQADLIANNIAPDGDFVLPDELVQLFQHPDCFNCKGILKPDIIFFGDNVPKYRKEIVNNLINVSDGLLCLGTSLEVYSSFSIIKEAEFRKMPIGIINIGKTRGDKLASFRLYSQLGNVMPVINEMLSEQK